MNNHKPLSFQLSTNSYGQVRAIPLLLANNLNSKLEQWLQNYKFTYLATNGLTENDYNKPLQLEYVYSRRTLPRRDFAEIMSNVKTEIDLLNYHQLVKIIHEYIETAYKIYSSLLQARQGDTILSFERYIDDLCKRFHKRNFPDKLAVITKDLGLKLSLETLVQINRVRNCLEHRAGIVSQADCDPGKNYISINFRYLKIVSPDGEMSPLSNIKGRQNTETNFTDEEKKFRKGEKILFDFYDNTKLIFSINICFKVIIDSIYDVCGVNQEASETILREFKNV